jgi:protein-disulfide isomerase
VHRISAKLFFSILITVLFQFARCVRAAECPPASKDINARIEKYLSERLVSGSDAKVSVVTVSLVPETCYRKFTIKVSGNPSEGVMYLSPDERFLTSTLYDLSVSPQQEVARISGSVEKLLMRDDSPQLAGKLPRVRLVEFGDLECPYTKLFTEWFDGLSTDMRDHVALVFKHLPLRQHPWAQKAATYSACAALQSSSAFWSLSESLLENQREITQENLKPIVAAELGKLGNLDLQEVFACATRGSGAVIVDRDVAVAQQLAVLSTPTLFINGKRALTPHSKEELEKLLREEIEKVAVAGQ